MVGKIKAMSDITLDRKVPDLLRAHPEVRSVLDRYGLHGCGEYGPVETLHFFARAHGVDVSNLFTDPVLRRTVARRVTLARACAMHNVDADAFVDDLNELIRHDASVNEPTTKNPSVSSWIAHAR